MKVLAIIAGILIAAGLYVWFRTRPKSPSGGSIFKRGEDRSEDN